MTDFFKWKQKTGQSGWSTGTMTYSQQNVWLSVNKSHALTWNPKWFGLVGEEAAIRQNLRIGKEE